MNTIATRLDEAMNDGRKKMSQSELSRKSGVPQPTISRILKDQGRMQPETATLVKLASALGRRVEWLTTGKGPALATAAPAEEHAAAPAPAPAQEATPEFNRHWLTNDEAALLAEIRSLTPTSQKRLRTITRSLKRDHVDLGTVDKL